VETRGAGFWFYARWGRAEDRFISADLSVDVPWQCCVVFRLQVTCYANVVALTRTVTLWTVDRGPGGDTVCRGPPRAHRQARGVSPRDGIVRARGVPGRVFGEEIMTHADLDKENGPFWEAAKAMCDAEIVKSAVRVREGRKRRGVLSLRRLCRREERRPRQEPRRTRRHSTGRRRAVCRRRDQDRRALAGGGAAYPGRQGNDYEGHWLITTPVCS
jgi:hypothetical protein